MKEYFAAKWELFTRYRKKNAPAFVSTTVRDHCPRSKCEGSSQFYGPTVQPTSDMITGYFYTIPKVAWITLIWMSRALGRSYARLGFSLRWRLCDG